MRGVQAAGRRALSERTLSLCAVVYLCYRLNEKGQLAPLSVYTFLYLREATKPESAALKLCVCSAGGLEVTEAEDQILFMIPFLAGSFWSKLKKMCRGLAFDLESASESSPDLCLTRDRHEDRHMETANQGQGHNDKRQKRRKEGSLGKVGGRCISVQEERSV